MATFLFRHDTNNRFKEMQSYKIIADFPLLQCCLVQIDNDPYRKADIVYYYQGTKYN